MAAWPRVSVGVPAQVTFSDPAVEAATLPPITTSWTFFFAFGRTTTVSFMANGTTLARRRCRR